MTTADVAQQSWTRRRPGWAVVARKEMADHLRSVRLLAVLVLLGLVGLATVYSAAQALRDVAPQASDLAGPFLRLFTVQADPIPFSFLTFVGFLAPVLGIAFGFDAVNGERSQGTLPRLVSQPIHRDDVINGKFVAGLAVISLVLVVVTALVAGVGILMLGITPGAAEIARLLVWLAAAILYVGVWLSLATLCSVWLRRAATSALVAFGVWLVLALFGSLLASLAADVISPVDAANPQTLLDNAKTEVSISRVSPVDLYEETSSALLDAQVRSVGVVTVAQVDRAVVSELSLTQSVLLVWQQMVGLVAIIVVAFAAAYVLFMRQEVRA